MPVIHRQLKRRQVVAFFQKLPVFLVPKCYVLEIDGRSRSGPPSHSRHLQRMQNKKGRGLNVDNDEQQLPVDRKQGLWPG
jgi:hypothetical protein